MSPHPFGEEDDILRFQPRDRDKNSVSSVSEKDKDTEKDDAGFSTSPSGAERTASGAAGDRRSSGGDEASPGRRRRGPFGPDLSKHVSQTGVPFAASSADDDDAAAGEPWHPPPFDPDKWVDEQMKTPPTDPADTKKKKRSHGDDDDDDDIGPEDREDPSFIDEEAMAKAEESMTVEEKEEKRRMAKQKKAKGNDFFKSGSWDSAMTEYDAGLRLCPLMYEDDRSVLYANRAAVRLKFNDDEQRRKAIRDCGKALKLNPKYLKARVRRAQINEKLDKLEDALADYKKALEQDPTQREAFEASRRLPPIISERHEKLKAEMMGKLKDLGNMVLKPFGLSTENFQLQQQEGGGYSVNFQQNNR